MQGIHRRAVEAERRARGKHSFQVKPPPLPHAREEGSPIHVSGLVDPGGISRSHDLATSRRRTAWVTVFVIFYLLARAPKPMAGKRRRVSGRGESCDNILCVLFTCFLSLFCFAPCGRKAYRSRQVPHGWCLLEEKAHSYFLPSFDLSLGSRACAFPYRV